MGDGGVAALVLIAYLAELTDLTDLTDLTNLTGLAGLFVSPAPASLLSLLDAQAEVVNARRLPLARSGCVLDVLGNRSAGSLNLPTPQSATTAASMVLRSPPCRETRLGEAESI